MQKLYTDYVIRRTVLKQEGFMYKKRIVVSLLLVVILLVCFCVFVACNGNEEENNEPKEYTIQYTTDTGIQTISVQYGKLYSITSIPEKKGYEFLGWYDAEEGGTLYVNASGSSVSSFTDKRNVVLYPQFKAKEYTLILDYQGAEVTGTRSLNVSYNSVISDLPLNLTMENKTFSGWYTQPDKKGTQVSDKYGPIPSKNIVNERNFDLSDPDGYIHLYAGFKGEEFTVTFYPIENGEPEEILVEYGTPISDVQLETRVDGNAVIAWSKKSNDINKDAIFNGKITSEMILYAAEYAPVIDFNSNGGENVNSLIARAGSFIKLPTIQRDNYQFIGWQTSNGDIFNGTTMPNESMQLNAKWQAMIVFDTNGGTEVENISEPQGTKITLPETEKDGYIFAGWYSETGEEYTDTAMPSTSIRLIAKYWKVQHKKVVVISDSATKGSSESTNTQPNFDSSTWSSTIDLKDLYDLGVRTINITAHYDTYVYSASSSSPAYNRMACYTQKIASDAYKLWQFTDEHTERGWLSHTRQVAINLQGEFLYVAYWGSRGGYYDDFFWDDFWLDIEYPDMSTLY